MLPALAQTRTEQPFQSPVGLSETPSGSPSVPGVSPADDPGLSDDASEQQEGSFNRVERDSSCSIQSFADPARTLDRSVEDRVEEAGRLKHAI